MKEENTGDPRKLYEAPQLHRVELTPEEIFAAACKTPATSSPDGATCLANSCFDFGS